MKGLRPARLAALFVPLLAVCGCGESKPVLFSHDPRLNSEEFASRPILREKVIAATNRLFGDSPSHAIIPEASGLLAGTEAADSGVTTEPSETPSPASLAAGESLYRRHCLHCHGVSGDGRGPTAPYVYPAPRDYRPGKFKFTSTGYGLKPSREDLVRTIRDGLDGTSMPAFSAQLQPVEIGQVVDYVIYLSMRGETEVVLTEEASAYEDSDAELLDDALVDELAASVFDRWKQTEESNSASAALAPRPEPTPESIERGRQLFLGISNDVKLECAGCHGARADGRGSSWIDPETFDRFVFGGRPGPEQIRQLKQIAEQKQKRWSDDWGNPLRPADLNKGIYKGGRRPIDLYWRIANGITGTPMPAHASSVKDPADIWHLVNFILALPHDPKLLLPRDPERRIATNFPKQRSSTGE